MVKAIDLTGLKFGRLTVLRRDGLAVNGNALWFCQCECGNVCTINSYNLRRGVTKSCGCLARELSRKRLIKQKQEWQANHQNFMHDAASYHQIRANNHTGVVGVSRMTDSNLWCARLMVHGKLVLNRIFDHFTDAVEARMKAEREYLPAKAWQFVVFEHTPRQQTRHVLINDGYGVQS